MRRRAGLGYDRNPRVFPFLFGGAFIEAFQHVEDAVPGALFPFLFGGAFIEAFGNCLHHVRDDRFPFLFGGAFIEAMSGRL